MAHADPTVTVTVIVYNDAERLRRAVASLRRQSMTDLEIIISDDHSGDHTPQVARELAAADERIVYHRLERNSGGCGAPRNAGIERARAPFLMFLDSDDELPPDACATLVDALRADEGLDFAMGAVERVRTDTGARSAWFPHLFERDRTVQGIRAEPGLLFEHLSTNKMYRRSFIDRHALRFPLGIHYEDQLFSAQAYCLAKAFAVSTRPVYRYYFAPYEAEEAATISNQRHRIENVRDRVRVARLIDAFLDEHGMGDVKAAKDHKFLQHDLRLYLGDLPYRGPQWIKRFADETTPYLRTLEPEAFRRLARDQRAVIQLVRDGRHEEARLAARGMGRGVAPREVTEDTDGRVYWGDQLPADPDAARELEISDLALRHRPFRNALLRHEITHIHPTTETTVTLRIHTFDPGNHLPTGPLVATVHLAPARRRSSTSFRLDPTRPGEFEGTVTLDLSAVPLPPHGFTGTRHPVLAITRHRQHNTGLLLAPLDFPPLHTTVTTRHGLTRHHITVEPEGHGAGRLQVRWERTGLLAHAEPHLPALRRAKDAVRGRTR